VTSIAGGFSGPGRTDERRKSDGISAGCIAGPGLTGSAWAPAKRSAGSDKGASSVGGMKTCDGGDGGSAASAVGTVGPAGTSRLADSGSGGISTGRDSIERISERNSSNVEFSLAAGLAPASLSLGNGFSRWFNQLRICSRAWADNPANSKAATWPLSCSLTTIASPSIRAEESSRNEKATFSEGRNGIIARRENPRSERSRIMPPFAGGNST